MARKSKAQDADVAEVAAVVNPPTTWWIRLRDRLRTAEWIVIGALLLLLAYMVEPQQLLYLPATLGKPCLMAWLGYWIDRRTCRPEDRPHLLTGQARSLALLRRAVIIGACILAAGVSV